MATFKPYNSLNAKQKKMALARWHQRQGTVASSPGPPPRPDANHDPLYNPAAQLSGVALKQAVEDIIQGQYRPAENALDRQAQTSTAQNNALAQRVAGYSADVDNRAAAATAREEAIAERLNQALAAVGQEASSSVDKIASSEADRRANEVALQNVPTGVANQAADELAAVRARVASNTQTAGQEGAITGANYALLANSNRQAAQLHGQEQQTDIANRLANDLAEIRAQRADLATKKGADRAKTLLDLRQSGFENLVTQQGLGIKQTQLLADIKKAQAQQALQRRQQAEVEANNAFNRQNTTADNQRADRAESRQEQALSNTEAKDAYQRENHLGPYKPASKPAGAKESADARKLKAGVENAAVDFKQLLSSKDSKGRTRSVDRVQEILRRRGAPPIVALAAGDLAQFGYVTPAHLRALRVAGVHIPASWRKPRGAATYAGT